MDDYHQYLLFTLSLYLLLFSFKIFAADSEPMASNMEECKETSKSFEEEWPLLQKAVDRIINQIEGVDNSSFTSEEYMSYYTIAYELCTDKLGDTENSKLLYAQYKKVFEEYINSKVLPSLRGKKDEILLRDLLRRWSNHKIMTMWLSRFFYYLERYDIPRWGLPSFEETSFLCFYELVLEEMNKQVMDALFAMIGRERAGEQIDRTLINNTLAIYSEIGDRTSKNNSKHIAERIIKKNAPFQYDEASNWITSSSFSDNLPEKEDKLHDFPTSSSKKINLISSDGDVFEVDYAVALMSKTIEDFIKTNPAGNTDSIPVSKVNSKTLVKVIEYCQKHTEASNSNNMEHMSDVEFKNWEAEFIDVDHQTLSGFVLSANYLNIKSLLNLSTNKIADMIIGKTPEEIKELFKIKDNSIPTGSKVY